MKMNRAASLLIVVLLFIPGIIFSQDFSVSPYSIFGIGDIQMSDGGRLAGLGGAGIGIRGGRFLNTNNPAAITDIDSTTVLFDVAGSIKGARFSSQGITNRALDANFSKVSAGTRLTPHWSLGAYIQPYSTVSYKIEQNASVEGSSLPALTEYYGKGGLSRFTIANGFNISKNISVGVNTIFLFGGIDRNAKQNGYTIKETAKATKILFDFGIQAYKQIGEYQLAMGVTGGYRNVLNFDNRRQIVNKSNIVEQEYKRNDTQFTIPEFIGGGISLSKGIGFILAADYRYQHWGCTKDLYYNRRFNDTHRASLGIAFIPNEQYPSNYFEVMQYQFGVSVSNSYLNLNSKNPINYEVIMGTGLPFKGGSLMNISLGYGKKGTTDNSLIREDYLRLILCFSISERWFEKRLYE